MGGAALDQAALREAYSAEDWDAVDRLVTDEVAASHAACGTTKHVRARLSEYHAAGLDHIILSGLTEPDEIAATLEAAKAAG